MATTAGYGSDSDSDSSEGSDLTGLTPFERAVKRDAYRRAKDYDDQVERYDGTEARLDAAVDKMKLWVKNTATEHDPDKETQTFVISVRPETSIKDLRTKIFRTMGLAASDKKFDSDSEEEEMDALAARKMKQLKLIYRGVVLEDGKVFDDYEWRKERWKWSKPYAGIVWISPFHPEPKFRSLRKT